MRLRLGGVVCISAFPRKAWERGGKAPDNWKEGLYKPIYARAGELGISKVDLYLLARERLAIKKPIRSLKELTQRDLQRLHHVMIYEVKKSGCKP